MKYLLLLMPMMTLPFGGWHHKPWEHKTLSQRIMISPAFRNKMDHAIGVWLYANKDKANLFEQAVITKKGN